jgi:hypothetical protein
MEKAPVERAFSLRAESRGGQTDEKAAMRWLRATSKKKDPTLKNFATPADSPKGGWPPLASL